MAGISSRAINFLHNKRKYNNGNELESMDFSDGSGLEMYDAVNRMYDPQIGRFWQIDELAEASWEWSPFFYANNNPISFNDPFGLDPEKSTEDNPKQLQEIVIISTKRMSYWAKMNFMYDLQRYTGGDLNRIESPHLREEMLRLQGHYNFRQKVADNTRKSDDATLQIASWLMPAGLLTKARYVKFAVNLFKIRRGVHFTAGSVDLTTQMIINKGDIKKVNIVSTVSSVLIGNPILSTVPGSLANLSLNGGLHLNSMSDFNVYKNIVLSSAGNIGGEKLGIGFKLGSTIPGSQFLGESIGSLSASAYDEMTNFK
jgi:RHS repeat-associated protein